MTVRKTASQRRTLVALLLAGIVSTGTVVAEPRAGDGPADWPQWRGPDRDGQADTTVPWPANLDGLERRWRVPLGKGYPGPIVAGSRVFVVETIDDDDVAVRALATDSGKELWRQEWPSSGKVPFFASKNGDWVRSTPAWDGETLYVGDMREVLVALDGKTGAVRWTADLPARYETSIPDFGFSSSPLIDSDGGGHLYVQAANSMLKLDPATGETVWRSLAGSGQITSSGAFSSPVIATLAGVRQLLVQTRQTLFGLAIDDGDVLWSVDVPNFRGMNILTPIVFGDAVFTSTYKNGSYLYSVRREGTDFVVEQTWMNKATAYMSSPLVIDGHAYVHLGNGRLDCINLENGESLWRSDPLGDYWSMIAQHDRILALDADGQLHLLQADVQQFHPLAANTVADEPTWGHLAVRGRTLFVRELTAISAWDWNDAPQAQAEER